MSRELFKMNMIASVQKLDNEDIEIIQNYIKTIEQENKKLKEELDYIKPKYDIAMDLIDKGVENSYKMVKDYKSRCEKAIEYIKYNLKSFIYSKEYKDLMRILGDKENE